MRSACEAITINLELNDDISNFRDWKNHNVANWKTVHAEYFLVYAIALFELQCIFGTSTAPLHHIKLNYKKTKWSY